VVVKLYSHSITHKTDVGGVELDLRGEAAVRAAWDRIQGAVSAASGAEHFEGVTVQPMVRASGAYELILGSSTDPQFGPVLLFGAGGQLVEIFGDRALGLPPLNSTLARRMMERTKIYKALGGVRGRQPVDRAALELLLVRFSQLVAETRRIREIDINPLLVSSDKMIVLDARVVLHDWSIPDGKLPRTAIRPYPVAYVQETTLNDGTPLRTRPVRPEDEPAMVHFHESLSERSVYFRYFHHIRLDERVAHERLTRVCFIDYDREMVLVTETADGSIVAASRLTKEPGSAEAEFAILVADAWQSRGLGTMLLRILVDLARRENIQRVSGLILTENRPMQEICRELGFRLGYSAEEGLVEASLSL
jgi:acetyltransferase